MITIHTYAATQSFTAHYQFSTSQPARRGTRLYGTLTKLPIRHPQKRIIGEQAAVARTVGGNIMIVTVDNSFA